MTNRIRVRAYKLDVAFRAQFSKSGILRQKTIPRMNRIGIRNLGCRNNLLDIQVALRRRSRSNANMLIGKLDRNRILVSLAVHGNCANPLLFTGTDNSKRNLATIRD